MDDQFILFVTQVHDVSLDDAAKELFDANDSDPVGYKSKNDW